MNQHKFAQMVREFPFLRGILDDQNLSADSTSNIAVARVDRNLLEIKPSAWSHDSGWNMEHNGHRLFWCVAPGEVIPLESTWARTIPYHRNDYRDAPQIGLQLLSLDRDVQFIVEVHEEHWDYDEEQSDIVIYKMKRFDWRNFCQSQLVRS